MSSEQHTAVAREFFEAFDASDIERLVAIIHPDVVWEVPGRSPVAGSHVGLDAVGAMFLRISEMSQGTVTSSTRELFASDAGVIALIDVYATPAGETWHGEDAWLIRTDGKQVTHVREHWFDARGFDEIAAWESTTD